MSWNRAQIKHACAALHQFVTVLALVVVVKNIYLYKTDRPLEVGGLVAVVAVYALAQLLIFKALGRLSSGEVSQKPKTSWVNRLRLDSVFDGYDPIVKLALKLALIGGVVGFALIFIAILLRK